jgi:hypothetical protein
MIETEKIKQKLQSHFKDIAIIDVMTMENYKEDAIDIKVYLDNGLGVRITLGNKCLRLPFVTTDIVNLLIIAIEKELNK